MADETVREVVVPPPLIYLAGLLIGLALDSVWPAAFLPATAQHVAGGATIALGLVLFAAAVREFVRARTSPVHHNPTTSIITTGVFRFSRNPIYVAMTLVLIGLGLAIDSAWIIAMAVPAVLIIHRFVIAKEEAFLASTFGDAYTRYRQSVRRWL